MDLSQLAHSDQILPNGARLLNIRRPESGSTYFGIGFPAGSLSTQQPGLAHFAEHMFLSAEIDGQKAYDYLTEIAPNAGAMTDLYGMVFSARCLPEDLPELVTRFARVIGEFKLTEADVESERSTILNECLRDKSNLDRQFAVRNKFKMIFGKDHPISQPVLGSETDIKDKITLNGLQDFMSSARFSLQNATIIIVGPETMDEIQDAIAPLDALRPSQRSSLEMPADFLQGQTRFVQNDARAAQKTMILFPIDDELLSPYEMSTIPGTLSRQVFDKLRSKGLVYDSQCYPNLIGKIKMIGFEFETQPETIKDCIDIFMDEIGKLKNGIHENGLAPKHVAAQLKNQKFHADDTYTNPGGNFSHLLYAFSGGIPKITPLPDFYPASPDLVQLDKAAKKLGNALAQSLPNVLSTGSNPNFPTAQEINSYLSGGITANPSAAAKIDRALTL